MKKMGMYAAFRGSHDVREGGVYKSRKKKQLRGIFEAFWRQDAFI